MKRKIHEVGVLTVGMGIILIAAMVFTSFVFASPGSEPDKISLLIGLAPGEALLISGALLMQLKNRFFLATTMTIATFVFLFEIFVSFNIIKAGFFLLCLSVIMTFGLQAWSRSSRPAAIRR